MNSDHYGNDIPNPFFNQLTADEKQYGYFQQGDATAHTANATMVDATAHTANATMVAIQEVFEDGIISRGLWPPRSPDPGFCNFYLWGNLKGVYKNNPHTNEALQNEITCGISSTTVD